MCTLSLWRLEEGVGPPETGVLGHCELLGGSRELNLGPLLRTFVLNRGAISPVPNLRAFDYPCLKLLHIHGLSIFWPYLLL